MVAVGAGSVTEPGAAPDGQLLELAAKIDGSRLVAPHHAHAYYVGVQQLFEAGEQTPGARRRTSARRRSRVRASG